MEPRPSTTVVTEQSDSLSTLASAGLAIFRPVRTGNALEETVERLLQAIHLGVVGPGQRLPVERELAVRLRVSRVTLREAIRVLQETGYVVSRRGRYGGTFVNMRLPTTTGPAREWPATPSGWEREDVLTLRLALESGAAEMAAARTLAPMDLGHLHDRLADTISCGSPEYRRKDSRLHLAIAEVAGSPSLTRAVADVRIKVNELLDAVTLLESHIEHSNAQHEAIVGCIVAGDTEGARAAMCEHLGVTAALLRGLLA